MATENPGAGSDGPPRQTRTTVDQRVALALLLVLVTAVAIAVARPGGPILADEPEPVYAAAALPPITGDEVVAQRFTASADGLSVVSARVGTYGGNDGCALHFALVDVDLDDVVAERDRECADIPDSAVTSVLAFDPIEGSDGREYELRVALQPGSTEFVTLWGARSDQLGPATVDGRRVGHIVEVHSGYGDEPRAWDQLGTAFDRVAQYGPPWRSGPVAVLLALGAVVGAVVSPLLTGRRLLVALVALAVAKGLLWSIITPPFEGVDEYAHVAYSQFLGEQHRIPDRGQPLDNGRGPYSEELEEAIGHVNQAALPPTDRPPFGPDATTTRAALDGLDQQANGGGSAAGYAPHYYLVPALIDQLGGRVDERVGAMRLWSVFLGVITVLLALALGRRLFPHHHVAATLLAVAVALHPEFSQQSAIVNNDAAVVAAGTWCLVVAVDLVSLERRSRWLPFLAGLAGGLAYVAKGFGVALLPVIGLAWLVGRLRGQRPVGVGSDLVRGAVGFLATYGTWFLASVVFGLAGVGLTGEAEPGTPRSFAAFLAKLNDDALLPIRQNWVHQFWGVFSWIDTPFPKWTQPFIVTALFLGAALVAWWAIAVARRLRLAWRARSEPALELETDVDADERLVRAGVLVGGVVSTLLVLYTIMFLYFRKTGRLDLIQGRYALLVVGAVLAAPAACLHALRPRWSPVPLMATVTSAMAALHVLGVALVVERFYL